MHGLGSGKGEWTPVEGRWRDKWLCGGPLVVATGLHPYTMHPTSVGHAVIPNFLETNSLLPVINASARREYLDISVHELSPRYLLALRVGDDGRRRRETNQSRRFGVNSTI